MIADFLFDYTIRNVILGAMILGIVSGSLGSFAVLRKQSLLGDAISHAALPGIALAFLLTGSKTPIVLLLGAAVAGWLGTFFILNIINRSPLKEDTALGLILSVFFGIGLVILTFIQKLPNAAQAGLDKYLFGQAATLITEDIVTMAITGIIVLLLVILFWKEFKVLTFDRDFGAAYGLPTRLLDIVLTSGIVLAIVLGLQAVGVVLMSAMVVIPAVCARQWTDKLGTMVLLSAFFGAFAGIVGALISSVVPNMPTGPTIVIVLAIFMIFSLLFAKNRGYVWKLYKEVKNRHRYALDGILRDLHQLASQHDSQRHEHSVEAIKLMRSKHQGVQQGLEALEQRGLVARSESGSWALTEKGVVKVKQMKGVQ